MKAWLRQHSAVFARFSPPMPIVQVCDSCAGRTTLGHHYDVRAAGYELRTIAVHVIGEVWIAGARLDKFCDGTES